MLQQTLSAVSAPQPMLRATCRRCVGRHVPVRTSLVTITPTRAMPVLEAAKRVPSTEAAELLQTAELRYLDVRTPEEYAAGRAPGAINIPFWFKADGQMVPNPQFVQQVKAVFPDTQEQIIVGCRSGNRSAKACAILDQEYTNLIDDAGGWLGWVDANLPVEQ